MLLLLAACTRPPPPDAPVPACLACAGPACTLDVDVPLFELAGGVTLNGAPVPDAPDVALDYRVDLAEVETGATATARAAAGEPYAFLVPAGTYDLAVAFELGGDAAAPALPAHVADDLRVADDTALDLDVTAYVLDGAVLVNGAPAPADPEPDAWSDRDYQVLITDVATGAMAGADFHAGEGYTFVLPPGAYDLALNLLLNDAPGVPDLIVPVADELQLSGHTTHDLAVATVPLTGTVLVDGVRPDAASATLTEYAVYLQDPASGYGAWSTLAPDEDTFALDVPPGSYEVHLLFEDEVDGGLPGAALAADDVAVTSATALDLAVTTHTLRGSVSVNGVSVAESGAAEYRVYAEDIATGGRFGGTFPADQAYAIRVFAGTYTLRATLADALSLGLPRDAAATQEIVVTTDTTADLDLVAAGHVLTGSVTVDGGPAPEQTYTYPEYAEDYVVTAVEVETGARVTGAAEAVEPYRLVVPPGNYDVWLWVGADGTQPEVVAAEGVVVAGDITVDLAVATHVLTGSVTFDGDAVPDVPALHDYGVTATELTTGHAATTWFEAGEPFVLSLLEGTYSLAWMPAAGHEPVRVVTPFAECFAVGPD